MRRKNILYLIMFLIVLIIIFLVFFWFPANYKNNLKVNNHYINVFKKDETQIKILTFSDINLDYDYKVSDLDYLIESINKQEPDIVIFNGDLTYKDNYNEKQNSQVISKLKQIKAIYGKFAVLGELDNPNSKEILINSDFEVISNLTRKINVQNNSFTLATLNKNNTKVVENLSDTSFNFLVLHNPSIVNELKNNKIDVIVTGHTLGGQYNLPFYGTIFNEIKTIPYYKGFNDVNGIKVYNSNGIGTRYSKMRFLAPMSIEVFNIN